MKVNELFEAYSEYGDEAPTGRSGKEKKKLKAPPILKMGYPGVRIVMGEKWSEKLVKTVKDLGFTISGRGYTDSSTGYGVIININKKFNKAQFEEDLRTKLDFDGWLEVDWYDMEER